MVSVYPVYKVRDVLFSTMDDTSLITVISHVAYISLPSVVSALMVVIPLETAFILPFWSTVATDSSEVVHFNNLLAALSGCIVAIISCASPSFIEMLVLSKLIPEAFCSTVIAQDAVFP